MLRNNMKHAVLSLPFSTYYRCRFLHLSSKNLVRRKIPNNVNTFKSDPEHLLTSEQNPNLNFLGVESDVGVIALKPHVGNSANNITSQNLKSSSKEQYFRVSFGIVRNDSDNNLRYHGQYDKHADLTFPHKSTEFSNVSACSSKILPYLNVSNNSSNIGCDKKSNSFEVNICSKSTLNSEIEQNCEKKQINYQNSLRKPDASMSFVDECFFEGIEEGRQATKLIDKELNVYEENNQNIYFVGRKIHNNANETKHSCVSAENVNSEKLNYIDENYFRDAEQKYNKDCSSTNVISNELNDIDENFSEDTAVGQKFDTKDFIENDIQTIKDLNFIDENYFQNVSATSQNYNTGSLDNLSYENNFNSNINNNVKNTTCIDKTDVNTIERECNSLQNNESMQIVSQKSLSNMNTTHNKTSMSKIKVTNKEFTHTVLMSNLNKPLNETSKSLNMLQNKHKILEPEKTSKRVTDASDLHSLQNKKSDFLNEKYDSSSHELKFQSVKTNMTCELNEDQQSTAHNVAKIHKEKSYELNKTGIKVLKKEKLDSKGFRILADQVLDLSHCTRHEIMTILKNNIVYSDDDILILNKPYSLIIHDSQTTKEPCLSSFLDEFAKEIDPQSPEPKLFTVHRIDKETTGCLLLARNQSMADNLKSLFAQRKITKKYWIVTTRVPEQLEGILDIPIAEGSIDGKKRMVLHPDIPQDIEYRNHSRIGKRAITTYKVLSKYGNAALVEVTPETGIKHQIRVHFGFGLSCPILGDHKYSHLDKLVPQKLPSDMLQRLQVRQSKVRYIPMHIHARSITVPSYIDGRSLFVMAPIPHHMKINMKRLNIKK